MSRSLIFHSLIVLSVKNEINYVNNNSKQMHILERLPFPGHISMMLWVQCGFVLSLRTASHPTQCCRSMPVLHCWHRLGLFSKFSLNLGFSKQFHKWWIIIFLISVKNACLLLSFFLPCTATFAQIYHTTGGSIKATDYRVNRCWGFEYFAISLSAVNVIASHLHKMDLWNFTGV